jgi:hypothetical protein
VNHRKIYEHPNIKKTIGIATANGQIAIYNHIAMIMPPALSE